ncbi:MAG: ubiquitin-like small modifier protein 1 [Actinomycetota bacterium]
MPVEVKIPALLRNHVGGSKSVTAAPGTLKDVLLALSRDYPGLGDQFFSDSGDLHRFVNVYVNDEDVRYLSKLETPVSEGDVVAILPAVAGGA